ncbi:hypothetical protein HPB52_021880 [Rhipicephalus sanguineus]|uniref:Insulin-like domain-containing protein n=1 Tax=Rhipicephalus sanguineus TaxID=34632 RepID=A0A9D4PGK8_RHISA|nr:hypothetical protein HPB52_021880 [Rhipicephalus sanguineus]
MTVGALFEVLSCYLESTLVEFKGMPPWAMEPRLGFLDAKTALQLLRPASHRQVRGIIEECCHKPCAVAELLSYCGRVRPASTDE